MAIVQIQPDANLPIEDTLPVAIPEPNKSIFTNLVPEIKLVSLLKYVEGYPWTIHYYGQILNANNILRNFDPSSPNLVQPYYEIKDLILQVSSPLSSNYDAGSGVTTISGSAITPYNITPNVADIFVANVDSGEDAIFIINSVSRKTYRKDTLYEISYNLYSYNSDNPSFIDTLKGCIQQTYYFNKDTNFFNRDSLIKPSVKEAIDRLKVLLVESQDYYLNTFAQKEGGTIYIPGVEYTIYDPLLLNFITKIIDYSKLADVPFFRHFYGNNRYIDQKSIYDALINRNIAMLNIINKDYSFAPISYLPTRARLGTAGHTGAKYILYPVSPNVKTDIEDLVDVGEPPDFIDSIKTNNNYYMADIEIEAINNENIYTKQLLHELFVDNSYVVSSNFYNYVNDNTEYEDIGYIEFLIYKYLRKEAIAKEDLVIAIERYMEFSLLHQLYLLPVLWLIIKANSV